MCLCVHVFRPIYLPTFPYVFHHSSHCAIKWCLLTNNVTFMHCQIILEFKRNWFPRDSAMRRKRAVTFFLKRVNFAENSSLFSKTFYFHAHREQPHLILTIWNDEILLALFLSVISVAIQPSNWKWNSLYFNGYKNCIAKALATLNKNGFNLEIWSHQTTSNGDSFETV